MTEATFDCKDAIALVETSVIIETEKAVDVELKSEDRRSEFVEAVYGVGARSVFSSNRPRLTSLTNEEPNRRTHIYQKEQDPYLHHIARWPIPEIRDCVLHDREEGWT